MTETIGTRANYLESKGDGLSTFERALDRCEDSPDDIGAEQIHYELNADFDTSLMDAEDVQALVAAWQMGAISRDTLLYFRQGEILPPGGDG